MARLDLNAKRAARDEAQDRPHEVVLGHDSSGTEEVFLLRPRMPLEFPALLSRGLFDEAMKLLLIDPGDWERMRAFIPEEGELLEIANLYGVDVGEPPASNRSSSNGGRRSRPTSSSSTASISPKRAGGKKPSASGGSTP